MFDDILRFAIEYNLQFSENQSTKNGSKSML